MTYKKRCNKMKGVYLKWKDNCVFPEYKYNSGPIVSNKILKRAKKIVIEILTNENSPPSDFDTENPIVSLIHTYICSHGKNERTHMRVIICLLLIKRVIIG